MTDCGMICPLRVEQRWDVSTGSLLTRNRSRRVVSNESPLRIDGDTGISSTPPLIGERSIVTTVSVCQSVHGHIVGTTRPIFAKFFMHVTHGRGSVLFWRRSDTLYTSGFMDDVTTRSSFCCSTAHTGL